MFMLYVFASALATQDLNSTILAGLCSLLLWLNFLYIRYMKFWGFLDFIQPIISQLKLNYCNLLNVWTLYQQDKNHSSPPKKGGRDRNVFFKTFICQLTFPGWVKWKCFLICRLGKKKNGIILLIRARQGQAKAKGYIWCFGEGMGKRDRVALQSEQGFVMYVNNQDFSVWGRVGCFNSGKPFLEVMLNFCALDPQNGNHIIDTFGQRMLNL